jgi:hypothetical protein
MVALEEAGVVATPEPGNAPTRSQTVEELFARLRAERSAEAEVIANSSPGTSGESRVKISSTNAGDQTETAGGEDEAVGGEDQAAAAETAHAEGTVHGEEPEREPRLAQRDDMLGPVVAMLARRLKRALTDDQNDILDRLRASKGWVPSVLPPEPEHIQRYAHAGLEQLVEAARSGASFTGGKSDEVPKVDDIASELAAAIVVPLRRRLQRFATGRGHESSDSWETRPWRPFLAPPWRLPPPMSRSDGWSTTMGWSAPTATTTRWQVRCHAVRLFPPVIHIRRHTPAAAACS